VDDGDVAGDGDIAVGDGGEGEVDGGGEGGGGATIMDTVAVSVVTGEVLSTLWPKADPNDDGDWLTKLVTNAITFVGAEAECSAGSTSSTFTFALADVMLTRTIHAGG
jgi:hypothetical protein